MWKLISQIKNIKLITTIYLAKIISLVIKVGHFGAGYTLPGYLSLFIYPDLLKNPKIKFKKGFVFVCGTNGKTTTNKLITHVLEKAGQVVLHNETGANIQNGIVSSVLLGFKGLFSFNYDYGVLEVDEFNLPILLEDLLPDVILLLNLSRDQLDRYGEIDIIVEKWALSLNKAHEANPNLKVVINNDSPILMDLVPLLRFKPVFFDRTTFRDVILQSNHNANLNGEFNVINLAASLTVLSELNSTDYAPATSLEYLNDFSVAYGRGESINAFDMSFQILLAKNPASFDFNLQAIKSTDAAFNQPNVIISLNDNIPDGRDVSWIFDVDSTLLLEALRNKNIYVTGTRCYDMAVRLKYAGLAIDETKVFDQDNLLLDSLKTNLKNGVLKSTDFLVLPNYSAMLSIRKLLLGRSIL